MRLGAVLVPINNALKGAGPRAHLRARASPIFCIADAAFEAQLAEVIAMRGSAMQTIWRRPLDGAGQMQTALYSDGCG